MNEPDCPLLKNLSFIRNKLENSSCKADVFQIRRNIYKFTLALQ